MSDQPNNNSLQEVTTKCRPNARRRRMLQNRGDVWKSHPQQSTLYNIDASQPYLTTGRLIQRIQVALVGTFNMIGMPLHSYLLYPHSGILPNLYENLHINMNRRIPPIWIYIQSLPLPEYRIFMKSTRRRMLLTPELYVPDQLVNLAFFNFNDLSTFYHFHPNPFFTEYHVPGSCELETHHGQVFSVSSQKVEDPSSPTNPDAESMDSEDLMSDEEQNIEEAVQLRSGDEPNSNQSSGDIRSSSGDSSNVANDNVPACVFCLALHESPEFYPVDCPLCPFLKMKESNGKDGPDWPKEFSRNDKQ